MGITHDGQGHYYLSHNNTEAWPENSLTLQPTHAQYILPLRRWLSSHHPFKEESFVHFPTSVLRYTFASSEQALEAFKELHTHPYVLWVEPTFSFLRTPLSTPSNTVSFNPGWHLTVSHTPEAWMVSTGNKQTVIAVIDSGLDLTHPEWEHKIVFPRDLLYRDDDPSPDYDDPHGTESAGVAVAEGFNMHGISGVCPQCSIMPLRIMGTSGFTRTTADADAIRWAADHGAHVLSNSWAPPVDGVVSPNLRTALQWALHDSPHAEERLVVFASGNEGKTNSKTDVRSMEGVLSVGASNPYDEVYPYSNMSVGAHLVAPIGTATTTLRLFNRSSMDGYTTKFTGTSAACPVAAGVLGLMKSVYPNISRNDALSILTSTTDPVPNTTRAGFGRINARQAVSIAACSNPLTPCIPKSAVQNTDILSHSFQQNTSQESNDTPESDLSFDPPKTVEHNSVHTNSCSHLNAPVYLWILVLSVVLRIRKHTLTPYATKETRLETPLFFNPCSHFLERGMQQKTRCHRC